jgi:hypothetical protein
MISFVMVDSATITNEIREAAPRILDCSGRLLVSLSGLAVLTRAFVSPDVGRHPTAAGYCGDGLTGYFYVFLNPIF